MAAPRQTDVLREAAMREALNQVSETAEPLMLGGEDAPAIEEEPLPPQPQRDRVAEMAAPQKRFGLFGRGRREERIDPTMDPRAAAAALKATAQIMARHAPPGSQAAQQVQQPVEPQTKAPEDLFGGATEDDRFEIPAFLRRQSN
jgi:hypothetical protein